MSTFELITLFSVLPTLATLLIFLLLFRFIDSETPKDHTTDDWIKILVLSIFYPIGILVIVFCGIGPFLVKEIKIGKK